MSDILQTRQYDQYLYFVSVVFSHTHAVLSSWPMALVGAGCVGVMLMHDEKEVRIP